MTNGHAPSYGDLVEEWACDNLFLERESETHYDAVMANGTRVQIKGAMRWVKNGHQPNGERRRCRGRFKLWENDHEALTEDDGLYLLVVYEDDDGDIEPVTAAFFTPEQIEETVEGDWYSEGDPRERSKGMIYRTVWTSFFEQEEQTCG